MPLQNDLFTWQSFETLAGATTATTMVTNGLCRVFPGIRNPAPLGLGFALLFCLLIAVIDPANGAPDFHRPLQTYVIAILNGFFVFSSAAGLSSGVASAVGDEGAERSGKRGAGAARASGFWRRWF